MPVNLAAALGDLLQGAVQPQRPGGEQVDHLVAPASQGRLGHAVAAGRVQEALVVAPHRQESAAIRPGGRDRNGERICFSWWVTVRVDSGRRHWQTWETLSSACSLLLVTHSQPAAGVTTVTALALLSQAGGELLVGPFA
ncbi:hypothetical protein ACFYZB_33610 [Streptomyces sp. NPDC001852]|uniref:hypothetical protein n=1 Tax=Streptomyces sp. NPDC001852 TaxID=3364619 RepID=UPI00368C35D3